MNGDDIIKYCPTCNRNSGNTRFVGEMCEVCVAERLSKGYRGRAVVSYCKRCGRLRVPGGHAAKSAKSLQTVLQRELCGRGATLRVRSFNDSEADVEITAEVGGESVGFGKRIALEMEHDICQDCYRKSSGYYEALVQFRGDEAKYTGPAKKLVEYITRNGAFLAKAERVQKGVDLYISDKKLVSEFFMSRKTKPKMSYTLYGIKNGRKVFRNTYLVKYEDGGL